MGLAPYGDDRFRGPFAEVLSPSRHGRFHVNRRFIDPFFYGRDGREIPPCTAEFARRLCPRRAPGEPLSEVHAALAAGAQSRFTEILVHVVAHLLDRTGESRLVLTGGCALNASANARLARIAGLAGFYVPPGPNDAGAAAGAALLSRNDPFAPVDDSPYLGPAFDDAAIRAAVAASGLPHRVLRDVPGETAALLAGGHVLGWFQGRMEFGPRALGARSILCDPRTIAARDHVNALVKKRESFRPLAPAVTAEAFGDCFEGPGATDHMLCVFRVRPEVEAEIPAITHVDHTARVQRVRADANPLFHKLLECFGSLSGRPVLLNTSMNDRGEPIVSTPGEALALLRRVPIDALVVGGTLVWRDGTSPRPSLRPSDQ